VNGVSESRSFDTISDAATADYRSVNQNYTDVSAASAKLFIRGVNAQANYNANSPVLTFTVPQLGINETFAGATRKQSQDLFEDWLKNNGGRLLKEFTKSTAIDPIAGNPNSLMSHMAEGDFNAATGFSGSSSQGAGSVVGIEAEYGHFNADGYDGDSINVPLSWKTPLKDGYELLVSLPLQYTEVESAKSYATGLGFGLRVPVTDAWSLTPALRAGVAGSEDLGAGSILYSGSLTSAYKHTWHDLDFTLGNMVSYYQSQNLSFGDISLDYDLQNVVLRNGLAVEKDMPFALLSQNTRGQAFVTNTQFTGTDLFIENYTDIGIALSQPVADSGWMDQFGLGATYTFAEDYNAVRVNLGYTF
jgi:hypothetical protein